MANCAHVVIQCHRRSGCVLHHVTFTYYDGLEDLLVYTACASFSWLSSAVHGIHVDTLLIDV
jgi:hypothetical protein